MRSKIQALLDRLLFPLFQLAVKYRSLPLAALIVFPLLIRINGKKRKRLLFLDRSIFRSDLDAMAHFSGEIQYVGIQRKFLSELVNRHLGRLPVDEFSYHNDDQLELIRPQIRADMKRFFTVLQRLVKFDGIITCNFGYVDQQEIFPIARDKGWPVVVFFKEGLLPATQLPELFRSFGTKRLNCDLLLCYNRSIRTLFEKPEFPRVGKTRFVSVGIPRIDWCKDVAPTPSHDGLVLFSFFPDDKIRNADLSENQRQIIYYVSEEFHKNVVQLAIDNSAINVVIKTKVANQYVTYVDQIVETYFGSVKSIKNLIITNTGSSYDHILRSKYVLGGPSTVLLESLLATRATGCPCFPDWFKKENELIPSELGLVNEISNFSDLSEWIQNAGRSQVTLRKDEKKALEEILFTTNFDASVRAEAEILKEIS
jgi:hypothetical protein